MQPESPVWGNSKDGVNQEVKEINRMLCRYYEHTFASNETSSNHTAYLIWDS